MISTLFLTLYLKYLACPWFFAVCLLWQTPWFSLLLPSIFERHLLKQAAPQRIFHRLPDGIALSFVSQCVYY